MLSKGAAVMGLSTLETMAALLPMWSTPEVAGAAAWVEPMKEGKTAVLPNLLAGALEPLLAL